MLAVIGMHAKGLEPPMPESIYLRPIHGPDEMTEEKPSPEGNTIPRGSTMTTEVMDLETMIELMIPVLRGYGVVRAGVFGSFVRGEADRESDLDLVVELPDGSSLLDLAGIKVDLEELFGMTVDVTTYNSLHPDLRDQILREARVVI